MVPTNDNQLRLEEDERAELLGDIRYDVFLSLGADDAAPTFTSQTAVDFRCSREGADTFVNLTAARARSVVLNSRELTADEHADAATIASVERLIDGGEVQVNCRRILMEGRDGLVRARAARAADASPG